MLWIGIAMGLVAALLQSLSYLAMKHYTHSRGGSTRQLLVIGHVWMGAMAIGGLFLFWPKAHAPISAFAEPALQGSGWYLLGQIALAVALRYAEPSRISPLLAFKIVVLALMTLVLQGTAITLLQWTAILLCIAGAFSLNRAGGAIDRRALIAVFLGCFVYSFSDWNATRLVHAVGGVQSWTMSAWAVMWCYLICGAIAVLFLTTYGSRRWRDWQDALPYALYWLGAMILLFACFGKVGVLYGNILQSTRGLMSVIIGFALGHLGLLHLEKKTTHGIFARRLLAAAFMTAAVVLYAYERDRIAKENLAVVEKKI